MRYPQDLQASTQVAGKGLHRLGLGSRAVPSWGIMLSLGRAWGRAKDGRAWEPDAGSEAFPRSIPRNTYKAHTGQDEKSCQEREVASILILER